MLHGRDIISHVQRKLQASVLLMMGGWGEGFFYFSYGKKSRCLRNL
jgi:hypothetical protein